MKRSVFVGGASAVQAGDIPKREFGKTGEMLTVIGPGGARLLNPADPEYMSFEKIALPAVVERGLGIQVMKSLGNGRLLTAMTARDCIHYALSLPTHCIALGSTSIGQVEDDVRSAQQYEPLSAEEMDQLRTRAARIAGPNLENWKTPLRSLDENRRVPLHDDI